MPDSIRLKDAAKYYGEEPHQTQAWDWLEGELKPAQLSGFQVRYRNAPAEPEPGTDQEQQGGPAVTNPLQVPYDCQLITPAETVGGNVSVQLRHGSYVLGCD